MLGRILTGIIRFYQVGISPWTPASCRYVPTCSEYARLAIEGHGARRGSWLALRRIVRCHPWGGQGFDPVPGAHPAEIPATPSETDETGPADRTIAGLFGPATWHRR